MCTQYGTRRTIFYSQPLCDIIIVLAVAAADVDYSHVPAPGMQMQPQAALCLLSVHYDYYAIIADVATVHEMLR